MDWYLYDNDLRHERVKLNLYFRTSLSIQEQSMKFIQKTGTGTP